MSKTELYGVEELQHFLTFSKIQVYPEAAARAINRTLDKMRTATVRGVSEAMGAKSSRVRSRIKVNKAKRASVDSGGELVIDGKPLNLIEFGAKKGGRRGTGVTASPWGRSRVFPHTFIATMPSGSKLVMVRAKRSGRLVGRLPIRSVFGPGVAGVAAEEKFVREREALNRTFLPAELERQLDLLSKRAPGFKGPKL